MATSLPAALTLELHTVTHRASSSIAESEEHVHEVEEESKIVYKPPAVKSIDEIAGRDENDQSLSLFIENLLENVEERVFWPDNHNNVILRKMSILLEGRPDKEIDLQDPSQLKDMKFVVKEGATYRLMITFNVQRQIVSDLRFSNKIAKGPFISKDEYIVGSYRPKKEVYEFKTLEKEFPSGMLHRGEFKVKNVFTDEDKNVILSWQWNLEIKKDWKD